MLLSYPIHGAHSKLQHGVQIQFMSRILGVAMAVLMGLGLALTMVSFGVIAGGEVTTTTMALAAGSSMMYALSQIVTVHGLGEGIGLMYMVSIAAGAPLPPFACCYCPFHPGALYAAV